MTRRLTRAIVGVVVATLVVAGLGTLVLARVGARAETARQLEEQAAALAGSVEELPSGRNLRVLGGLRRALDLENVVLARLGPGEQAVGLPPGLQADDLDRDRLGLGEVVTGNAGSLVFAAAPVSLRAQAGAPETAGGLDVVVVTRSADPLVGPATRWFLVAALLTVAASAVVASRLGRRLTGPVRQAEEATRRIAAGDLAARLPVPAVTDPRDEIAVLARSINAMAETLERSQGLERQFLLSVSHDLRTPLTSIRGYAEAVADGTAPDAPAAAGVILGEARRLERLVRDLLDLARLDARSFSLDLGPVDLVDVAAAIVDGFRLEADEAGVAIGLDAPMAPVTVAGDADRLAQVAANLVENALRFARQRVTVAVTVDAFHATLAVTDDGPGIEAVDRPHVFERLYVARHRPAGAEAGSGLGLAIVRELVAAMGGTAAAEAAGGGGARLVVRLPVSPALNPGLSRGS